LWSSDVADSRVIANPEIFGLSPTISGNSGCEGMVPAPKLTIEFESGIQNLKHGAEYGVE
jgi:hypothetical protein